MKKLLQHHTTRELLIILLLGLTPLLWFQGNQVILGHDAGLTLSPLTHFQDRLHTWTDRFGFGADQSYAIPGFFIHGLEALVATLGANVQLDQQITFVFWFLLPGLAMYYFASKIEQKLNLVFFALPVSILYMYNHFLLQGWFVAERTKFSLYAALPILLWWLYDWQDQPARSNLRTGIKISLLFFILNGMASLPLFGGILVTLLVFTLTYLLRYWSWFAIRRLATLVAVVGLSSLLLQSYWLLPYAEFVRNSYADSVEFYGGRDGLLGWIKYISQESSYINLFRLQGIPEWYQNPSHPYANTFLSNPIMLFVATLIPCIAFSPLFLIKDRASRRVVLFFSLLALVSMLFVAGSHPPFGFFYLLMSEYVPGFIAFRTPFYKFSPALWLAYSVLIGFSIQYGYLYLRKIFPRSTRAYQLIVCVTIIGYSYPFLTGIFFDYIKNERSMRISVPQYIYDYARWSEEPSNQNRRTLMLPSPNPDSNIESYTWGYWSLAPITTLLINNQNLNYNFYMGNQEKASLKKVYQLMERNDPKWIQLARFLQIDTLVLRKDFDWQLKNSGTANPELYRHTLTQTPGINQIKNFGNWDVFEISDHQSQKITQHNSLAVFVGADLQDSVEAPIFDPTQPIYKLGDTKNLDTDLIARADTYYLKPECLMCDAQWHFVNIDLYIPLFTRGSFLYPLFPNKVQPYQDPSRRLEYLSELSLEKILAYRKARDQKENGDVLITTLVDHEKALGSLMGEMEHVLSQATFDNNQLNSISSILRTERIILIDQINTLTKDTAGTLADKIFKQLYQNYQLLEKVQNQTDGHAWRSMQSDQKRFLLSVPSPGEYQIIYQPNSDQFRISDPLTIELNDQVHTVTPSVIPSASWYSLGSIQLGTGASRLEISQPQYNLVDPEQTSFERTSSYAGSCFISDKIAAQNQEIFRISFNHQRVAGNKDFFAGILLSESEIHPFLATDSLRISSYPSTYSKDYAVNKDSEFVLIICDRPENTQDGAKTSIAISDLVIQKLNTPEMLLYKTHRQLAKSPPELKLQKDDNTSYQTTISALDQPSITVLHETASPQWELSGIKSELFKINGYANGWVTQSQTTADITIKYQLESLLRIGFMISGAAFFILVIFLAVSHRPYANKN